MSFNKNQNKGRLKIFLGMAPGVGKTFSMLEEAQIAKNEQIQVVIGSLDTHGRKETENLTLGLQFIPKRTIIYKGREFEEMDLETILGLNPTLVLVDELSHSNIQGSKNSKRWQDVLEILEHGINVYTTINIQHIESLKDLVTPITGVIPQETIPDIIIERAQSIRLVDVTPNELLERLNLGKVYLQGQSEIAIQNFFQEEKLIALREMALKFVAEMKEIKFQAKDGKIEGKAEEKFLVAINHTLHSIKLIKASFHLASLANVPWLAVYVNTGKTLSDADHDQLEKNFKMVSDFGVEVITILDPEISEGIKKVAFQHGVTQIIVGRTPRNLFLLLFKGASLLDKLSEQCHNIDLHVIREDEDPLNQSKTFFSYSSKSRCIDYFLILPIVASIGLLSYIALHLIGYRVIEFLFFLSICILSYFFSLSSIILATIGFGFIWSYFFIPHFKENPSTLVSEEILLGLYILGAICIGFIADKFRERREIFKSHKKTRVLNGQYKVVLKNDKGILDLGELTFLSEKELMTAHLCFENGCETGWSTETLPLAQNLYMPIKRSDEGVIGILIFTPLDNQTLTPDEKTMLQEVCSSIATRT